MGASPWDDVLVDLAARRGRRGWRAIAFAAVVVLGMAGAAAAPLVVPAPAPPPLVATATLRVGSAADARPIGAGFWGANVNVGSALAPAAGDLFGATPVRVVRWPGGALADELNVTTGTITYASGATAAAAQNESQFVGWCEAIGCTAIVGLPGEIDDPATAAAYVAYTERTLGFRPAYWSIGNEPALWTHTGRPWASWNASDDLPTTPDGYAALVHAYLPALRAVDPELRLVGLPGVGAGRSNETGWLGATVARNGPNLSAVAIHVYPSGAPPVGAASLAGFFANLTGPASLAARLPADRAAVAAACPACAPIPILVTELGSGIEGGSFDPFLGGFPQVPYLAAELLDALALGVPQVDLYGVVSAHGGAWLDAGGATTPLYALYAGLLADLPPDFVPANATGAPGLAVGAFAVAGGGATELLLVNTDLTRAVDVALTGTAFAGPALTVRTWDPGTSAPSVSAAPGGRATVAVPPEAVVAVQIAA